MYIIKSCKLLKIFQLYTEKQQMVLFIFGDFGTCSIICVTYILSIGFRNNIFLNSVITLCSFLLCLTEKWRMLISRVIQPCFWCAHCLQLLIIYKTI